MKKVFFSLMMIASLALSACASPTGVSPTQPSFSDQTATLVPATIQVLPSEMVAAITPEAPSELLPHTLYYLNYGQIFRMERDGKTVAQITDEPRSVVGYDISLADGNIAFIADNQLLLINADGSERRVLVDGGSTRVENNPRFFKDPVTDPVFSPDGQTIAYARGGLNLYDVSTSISHLVIEDQYTDPMPDGVRIRFEYYSPVQYSPDGTKLLVAQGGWESPPTHAVYNPDTSALVRYAEMQDYINCCSYHGGSAWSPDSSSFYGVASVHDCSYHFGELWRVDAGDGSVTRLFNSLCGGAGTVYLPVEPFPAPDGQIYFFFGAYQTELGYWTAPALNMVRSAFDDATDRTILREDNFAMMNEALWAPDASLVIVAFAPGRFHQDGGVLELYYTDVQKSSVWLTPMGYQLKWGP